MTVPGVRYPAVAGQFYPARLETLTRDLDRYLAREAENELPFSSAIGCVVPHAGYMYSGHVAGAVYRRLPARTSYIILGPNHFGRGKPLATMRAGVIGSPAVASAARAKKSPPSVSVGWKVNGPSERAR